RIDFNSTRSAQQGITVEILAILFDCDWLVLRNDELRLILKGVELAGNAPESRPDFFSPFQNVSPDFQRQVAGRIACVRFAERLALLRPSFAHGSNRDHQP